MGLSSLQAILFSLLVVGMAGGVLSGLHGALMRAGRPDAGRTTLLAGAALAGWLGLTGVLAGSGVLLQEGFPPRPFLVVLPALVTAVVLARSKGVGRLLPHVPLWQPVAAQAFRIPVEGMLFWLCVSGFVPRQMTFEGMNFDVVSGVLALPVAWMLARGRGGRGLGVAYNVLGLVLLATIVTISILAAPGPQQRFTDGPPNLLPATFPMVWLPVFLVPLALFLHLISLRQLRGAPRPAA